MQCSNGKCDDDPPGLLAHWTYDEPLAAEQMSHESHNCNSSYSSVKTWEFFQGKTMTAIHVQILSWLATRIHCQSNNSIQKKVQLKLRHYERRRLRLSVRCHGKYQQIERRMRNVPRLCNAKASSLLFMLHTTVFIQLWIDFIQFSQPLRLNSCWIYISKKHMNYLMTTNRVKLTYTSKIQWQKKVFESERKEE